MTYTDTQLKQALAKLAPQLVKLERCIPSGVHLYWLGQEPPLTCSLVLDTELLHLCWLVEGDMTFDEKVSEVSKLEIEASFTHMATWQQRVIALAKVKGVEIV